MLTPARERALTPGRTRPLGARIAMGAMTLLLAATFFGCGGGNNGVNGVPTVTFAGPAAGQVGQAVNLDATVTDADGPNACTYAWSVISGPGTVTFGDAAACDTTVTCSAAGTYVLRLTANDGAANGTGDVTVTITDPDPTVTASAGADATGEVGKAVALNGTATGSNVTVAWTQVSGPGTLTFANANAAATTVTGDAAGAYVVRLTATAGALTASDDATVTLVQNQAPQVSAGPDVNGQVGAAVALNGTVTDDGLPASRSLTMLWTKVSGPGNVVFANAGAAVTTATFDAAGDYVVRLTASDDVLAASDEATVEIRQPDQAQRVLQVIDVSAATNSQADVPIRLTDLSTVTSAQFILRWNPAQLQYQNWDTDLSRNVSFTVNANQAANGELRVVTSSAYSYSGEIGSGSDIFRAEFKVLAASGTAAAVQLAGDQTTPLEVAASGQALTIATRNGTVTVP